MALESKGNYSEYDGQITNSSYWVVEQGVYIQRYLLTKKTTHKKPPTKAIVVENNALPVYCIALSMRSSGEPDMVLLRLYLYTK